MGTLSYPILYKPTETEFQSNGLGFLSDCLSCKCLEDTDGNYYLEIEYNVNGIHFGEIEQRSIIKAKVDDYKEPQLFRVKYISKEMWSRSIITATHISYDLTGIPVEPFVAHNVSEALSGIANNALVDFPYTVWTDKETEAEFKIFVPCSARACLGGIKGSILDTFGGELEFDNFQIKLYNSRGENNNMYIRYGKNLTDLKQEENCTNVYTAVYPYWYDSESGELVQLSQRIVNAPGTYNYTKVKTVDMTSYFETKPTEEELLAKTESYIKNNKIGIPEVSISISLEKLTQSEEYKDLKYMEKIRLYDIVHVIFEKLNVSAFAKVVRVVYDVILEKVESVEIGEIRRDVTDEIISIKSKVK